MVPLRPPTMSLQGVSGSSGPVGGRAGAADTLGSTTWGNSVSHVGRGGARKVGAGAVGGAPDEMLTLAKSLERDSMSSSVLVVPPAHGVPCRARSRLLRLYLL